MDEKPPKDEEQKVVFLKSVRNEQKDKKQPTRQATPKSAADKKLDERFYKLIEVLEEHQDRIRKIESNLLALARIMKAMREDFSFASQATPPAAPQPPAPPTDEE